MAAETPRRFEFVEGPSSKFWEVSTSGEELTTRWGKIGSEGQSKTKVFDDAEGAEAEAAKLIGKKLAEGYSEVGGPGPGPKADRPVDPEVAASVAESWGRIDRWLAAHARPMAKGMGKGAKPRAIAAAEARLGVEFPDAVRASYAIHDGSGGQWLFPSGEYLSLEEMLEQYQVWKGLVEGGEFEGVEAEPVGPIRQVHYHLKWVPLTHNGGGDHTLIDLAPAEGGRVGQLIEFGHETGPEYVAAPGLAEYLAGMADALEAGAGRVEDGSLEWPWAGGRGSTFGRPPGPEGPGNLARRRFEFSEGTSNKFWEVSQEGSEVTTRYGKIGSEGRSTTKEHSSPAKAAEEAAKLVASKVAEGYVEKP